MSRTNKSPCLFYLLIIEDFAPLLQGMNFGSLRISKLTKRSDGIQVLLLMTFVDAYLLTVSYGEQANPFKLRTLEYGTSRRAK